MHKSTWLHGWPLALGATVLACVLVVGGLREAQTQEKKPNILVIFGDDIGQSNISLYTHGLVGYQTPNIDRIAKEGMMFTDYYAENSCTAGRSTFITGQTVWRTGMSKVGAPGAPAGIQARDITVAEALKPLGYATGASRSSTTCAVSSARLLTARLTIPGR